jgi:hypothetical protein
VPEEAPPLLVSRLIALNEDVQPPDVPLEHDTCTIGRAKTCQIVVTRATVGRLHASVVREGQHYLLRDAGSLNGTFVNGGRITVPHLLVDRDEIGLGAPAPLLRFLDPDPTILQESRLRYDDRTMRFFIGQKQVDLAPSEFRLLRYLFDRAGGVCAREQCAEAIWGPQYLPGADADALDRVMANLRRKLRNADPANELIRVRRGLGYELIL